MGRERRQPEQVGASRSAGWWWRALPFVCLSSFAGCGDGAPSEAARLDASSSLPWAEASATLLLEHTLPYLPHHGLDLGRVAYRDAFTTAFSLTPAEMAVLDDRGFVVVDLSSRIAGRGAGPVDIYYRVFAADLPVFISADSILHAWHRSYDELLEHSELTALLPRLEGLLDRLHRQLDERRADERDAKILIAVARALLFPNEPSSSAIAGEVDAVTKAIASETLQTIELAGRRREMDFSQFVPRGHYAGSAPLERYFRAMMWLGRAELVVHDPALGGPRSSREERAALALIRAMAQKDSRSLYEHIERFLRAQAGAPNGLAPEGMFDLCARHGCEAPSEALLKAYGEIEPVAYASRIEPASSEDARSVVALRVFPQRFAYDAWVTSQTTSPSLDPRPIRTMASPLDVAFALGSDRAAEHLVVDMMRTPRLAAALARSRNTLHESRPSALAPTVYNHWLEALMALSEPRLHQAHPRVMQTAAWHDRQLEATLGSWAELRHDTVLLVEQSLGRIGCQYPKGYVEPVPLLYRHLGDAAARLASIHRANDSVTKSDSFATANILAYLERFQRTMERLATLAELELTGAPMGEDDLGFLEQTVDQHREGYAGTRSYDGWYPALFWTPAWRPEVGVGGRLAHGEGAESKPIVSDVHTDGVQGRVLEVGVSHPELMIVAVDDRDGAVALYGGPVTSFYAFERALGQRLSDNAWRAMIRDRRLPPRPLFAQPYRIAP